MQGHLKIPSQYPTKFSRDEQEAGEYGLEHPTCCLSIYTISEETDTEAAAAEAAAAEEEEEEEDLCFAVVPV